MCFCILDSLSCLTDDSTCLGRVTTMATRGGPDDLEDEPIDIHAMVSKRREKRMTPMEKMRDAVLKESATMRHLGR